MHQPALNQRFNPTRMHQPTPTPHQIYNPEPLEGNSFQRTRNFGPRSRGGRGAPQSRGHFYGAPPRLDMYNGNDEYWCETCDRSFRSVKILEQHKQQHEKCNIDGCEFIAHPKVITKHIQMQHSTGLFKKIAKLKHPEDIQKWREERKKKYPTKENVAKKASEIKEKIQRGEKMGLKQDRGKYSGNHRSNEKQKRKFPQNNGKTGNINKPINIKRHKQNNTLPAAKVNQNLKPFGGIQEIIIESDSEIVEEPEQSSFIIEDDDAQDPVSEIKSSKIEKPVVCGALTSLMCEYGSSDDDTEVAERTSTVAQVPSVLQSCTDQINSSKAIPLNSPLKSNDEMNTLDPKNIQPAKDTNLEKKESDQDSGPEEVKVDKSIETLINLNNDEKVHPSTVTSQKTIINLQSKKCVIRRTKPKVPSTLIYKLLHKEIRQERNIVLQCIRHIVKNNYFGNDHSSQI